MDERKFSQKLNSRKLVLVAKIILIATGLLIYGKITGDNWVNVTIVTSTAYMATNVWQSKQ